MLLFFKNYVSIKFCSLRAYLSRRSIHDSLRKLGGGQIAALKRFDTSQAKNPLLFFLF